jgi:hypothetical protein
MTLKAAATEDGKNVANEIRRSHFAGINFDAARQQQESRNQHPTRG